MQALRGHMHCKDVSVHETGIPLTPENIGRLMSGWKAYKRAEYIVLHGADGYAVVKFTGKESAGGMFGTVTEYEIVSLPRDTVYHEDPDLDVLNTPALAKVQMLHPGKTVVVKGMFCHINFIKDLRPERLRVIDNIPPAPSKLGVLVGIALSSGFIDHPAVQDNVDIDMAECVSEVRTEAVMFPCKVSELKADMPCYYLDENPDMKHKVTLIGCNLSKRIYSELYGGEVPFINVCPMDCVPDDGVKTIVKCCKVKEGHQKKGATVSVPWGATVPEVVDAINDLFSE